MELSVYLIDGKTRLIMPSTQWSRRVILDLEKMGHQVELTDEDPDHVQKFRSVDEFSAAMELIDSTGH